MKNALIPAVIQNDTTRDVLMVGYMNDEAFLQTKQSGIVWFWSRSKQRLWKKGETSGNVLYVKTIAFDCDEDAILIGVIPTGPACHTGATSCFYRKENL